MPKKLQKSLQDYLSKIKKPTPQNISTKLSSSKSFILSGCKHHPKTLSFAIDRRQQDHKPVDDSATLSDIDQFLFENFKSLYIKGGADDDGEQQNTTSSPSPSDVVRGSPRRFFVGPALSSSLMEESRLSFTTTNSSDLDNAAASSTITLDKSASMESNNCGATKEGDVIIGGSENDVVSMLPDNCIAVLTYSRSPQEEFRLSMHEMIEARLLQRQKVDWGFMEDLLMTYLNLNDKKSHRYVLSAFVDLIVALRERRKKVRHVT